jgi:hypothetical protein
MAKPKKPLVDPDNPQPTEENDEVWPIGMLPGGELNELIEDPMGGFYEAEPEAE